MRLVNEDKRQLIMEAKRLGNVHEPQPFSAWAYGKEKIRGAERNLPEKIFRRNVPKLLSTGGGVAITKKSY